jgi:hypothetical protein
VDEWLAGRMAEVREQADGRSEEHRIAAGAALAAMPGRGETVREISRMAGIGEKTARELMRLVNGALGQPAAAAAGYWREDRGQRGRRCGAGGDRGGGTTSCSGSAG